MGDYNIHGKPCKIKVLKNWIPFVKLLVYQTWSTNILATSKTIDLILTNKAV